MNSLVIGQLNLHNNKHATLELEKLVSDYNLDLVLIQEQYQCKSLRSKVVQTDNLARAGIYTPQSKFSITALTNLSTSHCAVAEVSCRYFRLYVVSCYFQYSDPVGPHLHQLRCVLQSLAGNKIVIGADVNASSPLWHGKLRYIDRDRRSAVEDFIAEFNLQVHNTPDAPPTFSSPSGESSIDVTLSSAYVHSNNIINWRVIPDASCSDHRLIVYEFSCASSSDSVIESNDFKYNVKNGNWNLFKNLMSAHSRDFTRLDLNANDSAEIMTNTFIYCADIALGRKPIKTDKGCKWWHDNLYSLRREFRKARRKIKIIRRQGLGPSDVYYISCLADLRASRSRYRAAVLLAKNNMLRNAANRLAREGPWSSLYRELKPNKTTTPQFISNIKINNTFTHNLEETAKAYIDVLLPDDEPDLDDDHHREIRQRLFDPVNSPVSDLPTLDEFIKAVNLLPTKKSAGEDKISNIMIKQACRTAGPAILEVFNKCIAEGTFPKIWRIGTIKLIPKAGDKPPNDPKSYRPITLLPCLGKLLERLVVPRLLPGGLKFNNQQFGFTAGKSTIDAAIEVRKIVNSSECNYVVGISLDIAGAFDNAWWPMILLKLRNRGCYRNIYYLLQSYFRYGVIKLRFGHYIFVKDLTRGCPQGSVLSSYLWNISFDDLLYIPLPPLCYLVGYADDGFLLVEGNTRTEIENKANKCLSVIASWGHRNRLEFAAHKTYQILLKGSLISTPRIKLNETNIKRTQSLCYLGLILENKFTFLEHIIQTGEKAKRNFYSFTKISTSTWGLSFKTLKIIYTATYLGRICYGSPVWADRATIGAARRKLLQSQRLALIFLCKAYRTVSTEALPVLSGVLPVDLEIQRRAALYYKNKKITTPDFLSIRDRNKVNRLFEPLDVTLQNLISEWQDRWDNSIKGRHLYNFFPSVRERLAMYWIEIDHCVAQFLTGHGNFKAKLYGFKLVPSPLCECSSEGSPQEQTAHHILWECDLWHEERTDLLNSIQCVSRVVYYDDLVGSAKNFRAFKRFCHKYYWKQSNTSLP